MDPAQITPLLETEEPHPGGFRGGPLQGEVHAHRSPPHRHECDHHMCVHTGTGCMHTPRVYTQAYVCSPHVHRYRCTHAHTCVYTQVQGCMHAPNMCTHWGTCAHHTCAHIGTCVCVLTTGTHRCVCTHHTHMHTQACITHHTHVRSYMHRSECILHTCAHTPHTSMQTTHMHTCPHTQFVWAARQKCRARVEGAGFKCCA